VSYNFRGIIPQDFYLATSHRVSQHRRSAQALSILGSSSAQLAHPPAQAAQVAQVFAQSPFPSAPTSQSRIMVSSSCPVFSRQV
jgi:hypothetical protein